MSGAKLVRKQPSVREMDIIWPRTSKHCFIRAVGMRPRVHCLSGGENMKFKISATVVSWSKL